MRCGVAVRYFNHLGTQAGRASLLPPCLARHLDFAEESISPWTTAGHAPVRSVKSPSITTRLVCGAAWRCCASTGFFLSADGGRHQRVAQRIVATAGRHQVVVCSCPRWATRPTSSWTARQSARCRPDAISTCADAPRSDLSGGLLAWRSPPLWPGGALFTRVPGRLYQPTPRTAGADHRHQSEPDRRSAADGSLPIVARVPGRRDDQGWWGGEDVTTWGAAFLRTPPQSAPRRALSDACEIYTDVDAFHRDPIIVSQPWGAYPSDVYEEMLEMAPPAWRRECPELRCV